MNTQIRTALLASTLLFSACSDNDNESLNPLQEGANITLRNTLEEPGETETTYPSLFGQADDAWDESGVLSNSTVEFATALAQGTESGAPFEISGLYEIDFTENSISFKVLPALDDPFWSMVFGEFPQGKFDRYYFTFSEPHNISGFSSDNSNLNVRIDSETVIAVELTEGYSLQPDVSFIVELN